MTAGEGRSRPLRKDAQLNRQRIIDAAREVFARRGLEASLDDVAAHAGVGIGTVYRHFGGKGPLIDALFDGYTELVVKFAQAALADDDPWQGLVTFLTDITLLQTYDRGFKQTLLMRNDARLEEARATFSTLIHELIARAQASGQLRADLELDDLAMIGAMVSGVADDLREINPDGWRRYLQIVIDGLVTSRSAPTALPSKPVAHPEFLRAQTARGRQEIIIEPAEPND